MENAPQGSTEHSEATKTVYFDRHGDVRFLVDDTYLVASSKTMSLISDPWKAMLGSDGSFSEAQPEKDKIIPLPEDDLQALKILLRIAHLQFNMVPQHLTFEQLLALAVLTDKYLATHLVSPWLKGWLKDLDKTVGEDGHEEWLWIAWEYGLSDIFQQLANQLVMESKMDDRGACVVANGRILLQNMPPDMIESILDARAAIISSLTKILDEYVDKLSQLDVKSVCIRKAPECHAILYGSLVLALKKIRLWPVPDCPSQISTSAEDLSKQLDQLEIMYYPRNRHHECDFGQEMKDRIKAALRDKPFVLSDLQERHLEAQHAKWFSVDEDD